MQRHYNNVQGIRQSLPLNIRDVSIDSAQGIAGYLSRNIFDQLDSHSSSAFGITLKALHKCFITLYFMPCLIDS